jgi:hypothetical protein
MSMPAKYFAKSATGVQVPLRAKTLLGAKREACVWACGGSVSLLVANIHPYGDSWFTTIAHRPVCPITGKVYGPWRSV